MGNVCSYFLASCNSPIDSHFLPRLVILFTSSYSLNITLHCSFLCLYLFLSVLLFALCSSVLSPSGVTACINVYGLSAQPKKALALLKRMQEKGVGVNVVQVTSNTVTVTLIFDCSCMSSHTIISFYLDAPIFPQF
jgi:pentatricopeptide repeat protein